jgi:hypothetical protein
LIYSAPAREYGETVYKDRLFKEATPTHSYLRYMYRYPYRASQLPRLARDWALIANRIDEKYKLHLRPNLLPVGFSRNPL